jgi:hypothetical protein
MTMGHIVGIAIGAFIGALVGAFLFSKVLSRLSMGPIGNTAIALIGAVILTTMVFFAGMEMLDGGGDSAALARLLMLSAPIVLGLVLGFVGGFLLLAVGGTVKKYNDS